MNPQAPFWIRSVPPGRGPSVTPGFHVHVLIKDHPGPMGMLSGYYVHLEQGTVAHEPHRHEDEELLVMHTGELDLLQEHGQTRLGPGAACYLPPSQALHTARGVSTEPARFFAIKWRGDASLPQNREPFILEAPRGLAPSQGPMDRNLRPRPVGNDLRMSLAYGSLARGQRQPDPIRDVDRLQILLQGRYAFPGGDIGAPCLGFFSAGLPRNPVGPSPEDCLYLDVGFHRA